MNIFPDAQPVEPREHAARLWRLIAHEIQPHDIPKCGLAWDEVLGPLQIATSIVQVEADTAYVDETQSVAYCRPAAEYEDAHSTLVSTYVKNLTVFVWTWIAFENAIKVLCGSSRNGIRGVMEYIKNSVRPFSLVGLSDVEARIVERVLPMMKDKSRKRIERCFMESEQLEERHLAFFYVAREARNSFVHGDIHKMEPEDWGELSRYRVESDKRILATQELIQQCLFALQMLLFAATHSLTHRIENGSTSIPSGMLLWKVLLVIHLRERDYHIDDSQMQIELDDVMCSRTIRH